MSRYTPTVFRRIALLSALLSFSLVAERADACSCEVDNELMSTLLPKKFERAVNVYRAKMTAPTEKERYELRDRKQRHYDVQADVLEVFKGSLKAGQKLVIVGGGWGDCTVWFQSGEWLIYTGEDTTRVSFCSRSRPISEASDLELVWLRTRRLPPEPVAVRRELVSCTKCDLETTTDTLVAAPNKDGCNVGATESEATAAWKAFTPFWVDGSLFPQGHPEYRIAVGYSKELRPFELVQRPSWAATRKCEQRVERRWCDALMPAVNRSQDDPPLGCIDGGISEVVCDEANSRTAQWGPVESLNNAACQWNVPGKAHCTFEYAPFPLDGGARGPILVCRPAPRRGYECVTEFSEDGGTPASR